MSAIKELPSSSFWSILNKEDGLKVLSQPQAAWRLYADTIENCLTGETLDYSGVTFLEDFLSRKKINSINESSENLWVAHVFYELGHWWNDDGVKLREKLPKSQLLGLIFEYQEEVDIDPASLGSAPLDVVWKMPHPLVYEKAYNEGLEHLRKGDCYQYNLTFPFQGKIKSGNLTSIIKSLWAKPENIGEFAGLTVCGDDFFLTNTPECLFEWSKNYDGSGSRVQTRPIKGTYALSKNESIEQAWTKLSHSKKDESELFMITDLLRNDLNRIERPSAKVSKIKAPLVVPGLLHSFSHIEVELSPQVSLSSLMKALFPGGSITGAPKIRVMQIIDKLENQRRGFYCGSTLYQRGDSIVGSINIRSAIGSLKDQSLTYHAGGGITVQSNWESEYQEMESKFLSFRSLLTSS